MQPKEDRLPGGAKGPTGRKPGKAVAIPPELEGAVLAKGREGLSVRAISEWLKTEHKVEAGRNAVSRFLTRHKEERAVITTAVVRDALSKRIDTDLDAFDTIATELDGKADALQDSITSLAERLALEAPAGEPLHVQQLASALAGVTAQWSRLKDMRQKTIERKLQLSGAAEPDSTNELAEASERVARRIASLAARADTSGAAEDPSDDAG